MKKKREEVSGASALALEPVNRMVQRGSVRVRARQSIGEVIAGEMRRFEKGEVFDCPAERVPAVADSVEVLPDGEKGKSDEE